MATDIVKHEWNANLIQQAKCDTRIGKLEIPSGYVSLTNMANAESRRVSDYLELPSTKNFILALSEDLNVLPEKLVRSMKGSRAGTWAHPEIASDFAQWVSTRFRIWANRILVRAIATSGQSPESPTNPIAFLLGQVVREPKKWERHFDPEWIASAEALTGWEWNWGCMSGFINFCIYDRLPGEVRDRLDEVNPIVDGRRRKSKQFQHFDDLADHIAIKRLIQETQGIMKASRGSLSLFRALMEQAYGDGIQFVLPVDGENHFLSQHQK
jgi:hypothetical protein